MSRSSRGACAFACALLWACSSPQFEGASVDATAPRDDCEADACESPTQTKERLDAAIDGSAPTESGASPRPSDAASDGAGDDAKSGLPGSWVAIEEPADAGADTGQPTSSRGSFCSSVSGVAFCSDFESEAPEAGFDYSAVDAPNASAALVATTHVGHDGRVLELNLSAPAGAKYVHDFPDDVSSVRIAFDVWVKAPPRASDGPLEIVKLQQEVPPDDYPGLSLFVHAESAGILLGNIVSQGDAGADYVATTFELPPLGNKWTRVQLDVWPGLSGRVRVFYDGVEQLDESPVRVQSDRATKTYASLGLYASKIASASVWYDNVIVDTDL